jgi:hypothetical protein
MFCYNSPLFSAGIEFTSISLGDGGNDREIFVNKNFDSHGIRSPQFVQWTPQFRILLNFVNARYSLLSSMDLAHLRFQKFPPETEENLKLT